jgi:hypothetical protein
LHVSNFGIGLAYDICEDEPTLDYIESEMAREGVTQEVNYIDQVWVDGLIKVSYIYHS